MWFVRGRYVVGIWLVYGRYVFGMWLLCGSCIPPIATDSFRWPGSSPFSVFRVATEVIQWVCNVSVYYVLARTFSREIQRTKRQAASRVQVSLMLWWVLMLPWPTDLSMDTNIHHPNVIPAGGFVFMMAGTMMSKWLVYHYDCRWIEQGNHNSIDILFLIFFLIMTH